MHVPDLTAHVGYQFYILDPIVPLITPALCFFYNECVIHFRSCQQLKLYKVDSVM